MSVATQITRHLRFARSKRARHVAGAAAIALTWMAGVLGAGTPTARAQHATTIGFETDCANMPTPGMFAPDEKPLPSDLYAPCGVASITSNGGTPEVIAPVTPIEGITGSVALVGPTVGDAGMSGEIAITFAPAVQEVAFDVLDLDDANGLAVALSTGQGADVVRVTPVADHGRVHFTHSSELGIERLTVQYSSTTDMDGWFVDQLEFNTWQCGDGEYEPQAGEACDDGNQVQCDGCDTTCKVSTHGCLDGTTCIAPNAASTNPCAFCDANKPKEASGEILVSHRPVSTPCDDELFCTSAGQCDADGHCQTPTNACDDSVACTADSCDEQAKQCRHVVQPEWCLIGGACYPNGTPNPQNACEFCAAHVSGSDWGKQAAGYQCGDPTCANGAETPAATCDVSGMCQPASARACSDGMCADPHSCRGTCSDDLSCTQQTHCVASTGKCAPDLAAGQACTRAAECTTGFCADGVCCDGLCAGSCEACNLPGSAGACTALAPLTLDPELRCGPDQLCGSGGQCMTQLELGAPCDRGELCSSGRCVDGVCCDGPCEGICEACNLPGQAGVCAPFALGTDPALECGTGGLCNGQRGCVPGDYETRGAGLCAARPVRPAPGKANGQRLGFAALLALASALFGRRRRRAGTESPLRP